jgi:hypothetical protein
MKNFRTKQRQATHIRTTFPHVNTGQCGEAVLYNQIYVIISYKIPDDDLIKVEACSIFKY